MPITSDRALVENDRVVRNEAVWNLVLLAQIGLFLFACAYAHPVADDLDFASSARQSGLLTAWRQQYVTWNGRYTSNLLALAGQPASSGSIAP